MKLFTKSSILKSTTVEIVSPKILECPSLDKGHKKLMPQGVPVEFPIFSESGEDLTIQDEENRHEQQPEERHVIEQAKAEAEQILAEARQEADHIIKEAQQIAETLKTTMEQEVRSEIIPIARAEGYEKGLKEGLEEAERLRIQSKAYLEMAQTVLVDELHKADREMVRLCLQISERIVHSALNHNPEKLLSIIRSLTLLPREKDGMRTASSGR
jgi:flagellar assembly protein FliH